MGYLANLYTFHNENDWKIGLSFFEKRVHPLLDLFKLFCTNGEMHAEI
ncbi:hypothetical protein [Legionella maceachernii]|nr:hypothetical protein [Legionella maceachernii]